MNYTQLPVTMNMWRVIFFERVGTRVKVDRSGLWLASKDAANDWAEGFENRGDCVALQSQQSLLERRFAGLPL